ncbi:MAG: hypothetical protein IH974_09805 [Myxococcales bacterium]|nr:hypothetical protein [Myxococcales bacterium]
MEGDAYLGELASGIIYLLAGTRLVLLGVRTREAPERLLGASFLAFGVSGVLYSIAVFESLAAFWTPLNFAARVAFLPSAVLVAVFTARVFRPDDRWARWLVRGVAVLLVAGVGGSALKGDWEGFSLSNGWFWLEWVGYTLPFGWAAAEALHQYLQARRRVRVGLCEPSVCNRMFLWSLYGLIQMLSNVVLIGQYAAYERENVFSSTWDFLYGGTILAALVVMWFAFFPPKIYLHWINRTTPVSL